MDTSYLAQQVTTIIGQLHGLFDDIGIPSHERDTREAEVPPSAPFAHRHTTDLSAALLRPVRDSAQSAQASHQVSVIYNLRRAVSDFRLARNMR
jgi:hypothetical protein